jgi:hypothetical protein
MKQFLNSDWLRAVQFFCNTVPMKYSVKNKYRANSLIFLIFYFSNFLIFLISKCDLGT